MIAEHFRTFLWLHWRLRVNQWRRAGTANAVVQMIRTFVGLSLAVVMLVGLFLVGLLALKTILPRDLMFIWDALVVAFLFFWAVGLFEDLQRSEALSLAKFLHLPISLSGVFALNYLSSLVNLTLILFLPGMIGLTLGLAFARGPVMLLQLPLIAAFVLMITGSTYQFQGWLASLMVNKRRRRTILTFATIIFVLIFQIPNLINAFGPWNMPKAAKPPDEPPHVKINPADPNHPVKITPTPGTPDPSLTKPRFIALSADQVAEIVKFLSWIFPPGWLPLGARALAEGNYLIVALSTIGMSLIGGLSLGRAYRTTLRLYTGDFTARKSAVAVAAPKTQAPIAAPSAGMLEAQLPWVSEQTSAVALAALRSFLRAPEAKMMLLSPLMMLLVFGSLLFGRSMDMPDAVRPLLAYGAMVMALITMVQLGGNQFGLDRSGFRVFVLSPAPRRDILLGKNLACAPFALVPALLLVAVVNLKYPMSLERTLSLAPQILSTYLLVCLIANVLSITVPVPIASGSFRPANFRAIPILCHTAFVFFLPILLSPTLIPLGLSALFEYFEWLPGVPINFLFALAECALIFCLYRWLLGLQGNWLQRREKKILEVVAAKAE